MHIMPVLCRQLWTKFIFPHPFSWSQSLFSWKNNQAGNLKIYCLNCVPKRAVKRPVISYELTAKYKCDEKLFSSNQSYKLSLLLPTHRSSQVWLLWCFLSDSVSDLFLHGHLLAVCKRFIKIGFLHNFDAALTFELWTNQTNMFYLQYKKQGIFASALS